MHKSERMWRDAIIRAVKRREGKGSPRALELLASKLVASALQGDIAALREIGDRLDGKAQQAIVAGDGGPLRVEIIRFGESSLKLAPLPAPAAPASLGSAVFRPEGGSDNLKT